jgi:hypothetical protein
MAAFCQLKRANLQLDWTFETEDSRGRQLQLDGSFKLIPIFVQMNANLINSNIAVNLKMSSSGNGLMTASSTQTCESSSFKLQHQNVLNDISIL